MSILNAAFAFVLDGKPVSYQEFGSGHINNTYLIKTNTGIRYVLQHINKYVFKHPEQVMENVSAVTNYLLKQNGGTYTALHYMQTPQGLYYHLDCRGEYWRMYEFIPGICLNMSQRDEDLYQSALAFGQFQDLLKDFPAETLHETIPNFHNTIDRYQKFKTSVMVDAVGRRPTAAAEIAQLLSWEEKACILERMRAAGDLPLRVTHNDTKLNNVLLNEFTHEALCVLDLDTVMPGLSLYDFGDAIRFGASTAAEDETDLRKVTLDLHLFELYAKGYLESVPSLTDNEIEMLPMGAFVMTVEVAVRFLKDYLDGDLYFKIHRPDHNLIRARNQIALAADMERKLPEMAKIIEELRK